MSLLLDYDPTHNTFHCVPPKTSVIWMKKVPNAVHLMNQKHVLKINNVKPHYIFAVY